MEPSDSKETRVAQARVPIALHIAATKKMADDDQTFQSLIVAAIEDYVNKGGTRPAVDPDAVLGAKIVKLIKGTRQAWIRDFGKTLIGLAEKWKPGDF